MRPRAVLLMLTLGSGLAAQELAIRSETLAVTEDGPPVARGTTFATGSPVALTFRIAGFGKDEEETIHLVYTVEALDPGGSPVATPKTGTVAYELAPQDKKWTPIARYQIYLPARAAPGTYNFRIKVDDKRTGQTASKLVPFVVTGRTVESAASLSVQGLRFLRTEDDGKPLAEGETYAAGAKVWVRFDIVGFQRAAKNRYDVSYGLEMWAPNGKLLFAPAKPATETAEPVYPVTYIPAAIRLDLDPKAMPGRYRLVLRLRDAVGGTTSEQEFFFDVR